MQRAPRVARLVAVALLGGLAVAGCRSQPGVAGYVGNARLTDDQVERMVSTIEADVRTAGGSLQSESYANIRQVIVQLTVFNEIAKRYASEKGHAVPATDYQAASAQIGLPVSDPYVRLAAEADNYRQLLLSKAQPASPTESDLRYAFDQVIASGASGVPSYAQLKPQLEALRQLRTGLGLRNELEAASKRYDVAVNPRFQPLHMPLASVPGPGGQGQIWLVNLPLGPSSATPAVIDR